MPRGGAWYKRSMLPSAARGETPVIARPEFAADLERELDQNTALQRQPSAGRRHRDAVRVCRGVEVMKGGAVGTPHDVRLVPAADAGVAAGIGVALRVDREE